MGTDDYAYAKILKDKVRYGRLWKLILILYEVDQEELLDTTMKQRKAEVILNQYVCLSKKLSQKIQVCI